MRLAALHLIAYGPFTNRTIEFGSGGLQLVFGPNEGGKSSSLRAIDALLFGIPPRTSDNFVHSYGDLKVGATLVNQAGQQLSLVRRKKQRKSLTLLDDFSVVLPENALDDFLCGLQQDTFQRLYCINHDEFRAGGDRMRQLKGLLGESLFAASLGGAGLTNVLEGLAEEAAHLYGKRSGTIRSQIAAYKQAKDSKDEHRVLGKKWEALKEEFDTFSARKAEIVRRQTQLDASKRRLERVRSALPKIAEWKALRAELAGQEAQILPESYSGERRSSWEAELAQTQKRIEVLSQSLSDNQAQMPDAEESPTLIYHAATIETLQQRVGAQLTAAERRAQEERQLGLTQTQARRLLSEIGLDSKLAEDCDPQLRRDHRAAVHDLVTDEKRLRDRARDVATKQSELANELQAIDDKLSSIEPPKDTTKLHAVLRQALRRGNLEQELEQARSRLRTLQRHVTRHLDLLPSWNGSLELLVTTTVPLRETVDQFADSFARVQQQIEALDQRLLEKKIEQDEVSHAIAAFTQGGGVVTEADLCDARQQRDLAWQRIWQIWKAATNVPSTTDVTQLHDQAQAYEHLVGESDTVADRLRREADQVAELTLQQKRHQTLASAVTHLQREREQRHQEQRELRQRWNQAWSAAEITQPGTPREMAAWIGLRETLLHQATELEECQEEILQLDEAIETHRQLLLAAMNELDQPPGDPADTLERLCEVASETIQRQQSLEIQRQELLKDRKRVETALAALELARDHEQAALEQWQESWTEAMSWLDCPPKTTGAQALERVRCLDDFAAARREAQRLAESVATLDEEMTRFCHDVAALVERVSPELADLPAVEAAKELKARLDRQRLAQQKQEHRDQIRRQHENELAELHQAREQLELQLAQLCQLAGVVNREGLVEVERISRSALRLRQIEDELRVMSATTSLSDFIETAETSDAADLEAQIAQLELEIAEQNEARDAVVSRLTQISHEMESIDGNDAAARADQRAMSHLAGIHEDAGRYMRLMIAASILRRQIDRYREDNKDPLLAKASEYFARMTCDEFVGVQADFDDRGQPIIVGVRRNKEHVTVEAMSDGTLDPLFLSLRLAYLQRRLGQQEPMPLIVDDILIHLDDQRALATLHLLAELATQTQVLFFTHHQRLKQLAERHLPEEIVDVHVLERRSTASAAS